MPDIYFEDLVPGAVTEFGPRVVTRDEIVAYARRYDPQPFHIGEEEAAATPVGRLIASGWHTLSIQMRMLCDAWLLRSAGLGGPGLDEVEWLRPMLPGDALSVRQTILAATPSRSRPEMGIVRLQLETLNGAGEVIARQNGPIMFARRDVAPSAAPTTRDPGPKPSTPEAERTIGRRDGQSNLVVPLDEIEIGTTEPLGEHRFDADAIVRFARDFDPQPFHLSEEGARTGPFGRLAASGWQTAALFMSLMVRRRTDAEAEALAAGRSLPLFGPSPGFKNLRWLHPVFAGDTIRFDTTVIDTRPVLSRPGWGLVASLNCGWNERGEKVFAFEGRRFVSRAELG